MFVMCSAPTRSHIKAVSVFTLIFSLALLLKIKKILLLLNFSFSEG